MQNIRFIMDKFLRNHTYEITVIHWISYLPFEQPGPVFYRHNTAASRAETAFFSKKVDHNDTLQVTHGSLRGVVVA